MQAWALRDSSMDLGRIGVWSMELRFGDRSEASAAAAEIETLGYGAIWVPGGIGGDVTGDIDHLLAATQSIVVASGFIHASPISGPWLMPSPSMTRLC